MNKMKNYNTVFSACAIASICNFAFAETAEDNNESNSVERISIYGTTNPIPVIDYPGQITVIEREEIEFLNPSTMSDLLRDVAGVEFSGGPRRTGETPSIRGRDGENVLILLDGARQSFISAHDGRFFLDPELVQVAEVVKGPASSLYGSGAVGGVLAFETADAADLLKEGTNFGLKYRLGYQDVNNESLLGITGFAKQNKLDVIFSLSARNSGDIELGSGATLPSDDDIITGFAKASYAVNDALTLEVSWQSFTNDVFEPNNGQGLNFGDGDTLDANVFKDITSDTLRFAGNYNPKNNNLINTNFTLYQANTDVEEFDPTLPRTTLRDIETTGFSVRNASEFNTDNIKTTLTVGLDYYKDEQVGTDDNNVSGTRNGVPNGEAEFSGVYAQLEVDIDEPLGLPGNVLIIPGVRYDSFENEAPGISEERNDDSAFSPRLALSYGFNDALRLFASYSEAFRAPSINELFLTGVHFNVPHPVLFNPQMGAFVFINNNFVPNPDLDVEESDNMEFGVSYDESDIFTKGDVLQAKASYFQSDVNNLIDLRVNVTFEPTCFMPPFLPCSAGTSDSFNIANAELDGYELEAIYENSNIRLGVTFSTVEGEDLSNGSDLGVLTPDRLNIDLRYKLTEYRAVVGTRLQFANGFERFVFDADTNAQVLAESRAGYGVVDIYSSWQPAFLDGLSVNFGVDNVFDRDYDRVFSNVSEPGRNVNLTLSYAHYF
ncbi:MAG: TonB-dependent hemoglobin/transferrin/lactoferrin family receptor [Pseudomonadota bacterium]